jgi:hypothetical protein
MVHMSFFSQVSEIQQTSIFLLFKSVYKAEHASGFARDHAFNTIYDGICFVTLGPDFCTCIVLKTLGPRSLFLTVFAAITHKHGDSRKFLFDNGNGILFIYFFLSPPRWSGRISVS